MRRRQSTIFVVSQIENQSSHPSRYALLATISYVFVTQHYTEAVTNENQPVKLVSRRSAFDSNRIWLTLGTTTLDLTFLGDMSFSFSSFSFVSILILSLDSEWRRPVAANKPRPLGPDLDLAPSIFSDSWFWSAVLISNSFLPSDFLFFELGDSAAWLCFLFPLLVTDPFAFPLGTFAFSFLLWFSLVFAFSEGLASVAGLLESLSEVVEPLLEEESESLEEEAVSSPSFLLFGLPDNWDPFGDSNPGGVMSNPGGVVSSVWVPVAKLTLLGDGKLAGFSTVNLTVRTVSDSRMTGRSACKRLHIKSKKCSPCCKYDTDNHSYWARNECTVE